MRRFTPEDDQYIRDNYMTQFLREIGEHLGRTEGTVCQRMKVLGLALPENIKTERLQKTFQQLTDSGKTHRFQKGLIPHNKGKKMDPEVYERCKGTMFKPGQLPKNCVHFGKPYLHTRIKKDGYIERTWFIQEGTNKRSAYLAYLCRQNNIDLTGKKPILRDGFDHSRTPTIDDIMIVTNAENMQRNTVHRYPKEVVRLCQLKGALQRQINKLQTNE
jgi:hypothetical protein